MQTKTRIEEWFFQRKEDLPARPDGHGANKRIDEPIRNGLCRLIRATRANWYSSGETERICSLFSQTTNNFRRRMDPRKNLFRQSQAANRFPSPFTRAHIEKARTGRIAVIAAHFVGHPIPDIVFGQYHSACVLERLSIEGIQPVERRNLKSRSGRGATGFSEEHATDQSLDFREQPCAPLIGPYNRRSNRFSISPKQNSPVHLTGKSDSQNFRMIGFCQG